ncbi:c-type cytochrome biogenesis protein CcsB [Dehalogenimonas etheniformans]|uniref:C-type cytochrome biogenesis protein CcsB n=1 Tax=Dehalogenimonas etheniformans TaxID=1536648 RepID=A0A2P5P5W8_9CHLR|nr:c-type cytochrome biogenesis protein CcsB [Dehalogenimonas etheniformans]PPD57680.1 c-type cytochrome biogenesis protein CcsB [Dehalogenimonas etheniformans]QNT76022.1 c-type cytochrome biogenesis protein CcsB [Dehalogenimonas etheniformans]
MEAMQAIFFWASLLSLGLIALGLIIYISSLASARGKREDAGKTVRQILIFMMWLSFALLSGAIATRWAATGHGPFSSMFEFALAFAWGIIGLGILYWMRYKTLLVSGASSVIALALIIFAAFSTGFNPTQSSELVPALQQNFLLSTHVAAAALSYGAFAIGFVTSIMFLMQRKRIIPWMPSPDKLDRISYNTVIVGFPLLTLVIILGALWAHVAWGRYWSWDPKETAALVTWFFYAAYLHTRVVVGWQGNRSAVLLVIAFLAVIFTFFGNYFFSGLHAFETGG